MEDSDVQGHIEELIAEEHRLREIHEGAGEALSHAEKERLDRLEVDLDRYWDLLRQRRSIRETGGDPDDAALRDPNTVEGYEQ